MSLLQLLIDHNNELYLLTSTSTPVSLQVVYGAIICFAHILWFGSLSFLLGQQSFLSKTQRFEPLINKALGIVLVLFSLKIVYL